MGTSRCRDRGVCKISLPSSRFCYKPNTALKQIKSFLKKEWDFKQGSKEDRSLPISHNQVVGRMGVRESARLL